MKTVLVIGGAGTFGTRIVTLLAETGAFRLLIGGRDLAKAERVRKTVAYPHLDIYAIDRKANVAAQLAALMPWAVVDAAGPFQDESETRYAVPQACMALGIHYIDLADSRDFVTGITALDPAARTTGVTVISGASSVPALSTAVVDALATAWQEIAEIDIALSASNRATAGPNVTTAILGYVGRPIRYLAAGIWRQGYGWQNLVRKSFAVAGHAPIRRRLVGLCDVPDLDLLPQRFPRARSVVFRAGAELTGQNLVLWLLSFAVRWRWIASLQPVAWLFHRLQGVMGFLGSDRSAMSVSLTGRDAAGEPATAQWTLIAEDGHGPWVPSFAAVLLVQKLAAGELRPSARPAGGLLVLADFAPLLAKFHLFTEVQHLPLPAPLYARVLGADFARMPAAVQALHRCVASHTATGRGKVRRGSAWLARIAGWLFGFPSARTDVPVSVGFTIGPQGEVWRRDFGGNRFRSHLSSRRQDGRTILTETFWPFTFDFDLAGHADGLDMNVRGWRCLGLPLPRVLAPQVSATERVVDGRFTFDVRISLPWGPLIVHYRGWPLAAT